MTSDRPYRDGMGFAKAEKILREGAGRQWQSEIVDAFFARAAQIRLVAGKKTSPETAVCSAPRS